MHCQQKQVITCKSFLVFFDDASGTTILSK